jgi:RNA polymerase sigma-54 factor
MQAIRLLQMSGVELDRFVAEELEQNPLLDADESPESDMPDSGGEPQADAAPASTDVEADAPDAFSGPIGLDSDAARAPLARGTGSAGAPYDDISLDQRLPATESLEAMLGRTIDTVFAAPAERAIALALLSELDEAGYLTTEPAAIASRLGASPLLVERVLGACQDLAPTGIFARSLAECLELQLAERTV